MVWFTGSDKHLKTLLQNNFGLCESDQRPQVATGVMDRLSRYDSSTRWPIDFVPPPSTCPED
jgi:hypothetical protein